MSGDALRADEIRHADGPIDRDYVLGTGDEEIVRLGIQHAAWRPFVRECWARGGVRVGDRVIDVGAGPGCAAQDLAELVGPSGSVIAVERSARFVAAGRTAAVQRRLDNIEYRELDLMRDPLPGGPFDAAWCRWVASFVDSPEVLISEIARVIRPGGVAMFHEYADYGSWRFSPRLPLVEAYISNVMDSWRAAGGEPDVACDIPPLLESHGFAVTHVAPRVFCVRPGSELWNWISTFVALNFDRMVELGASDTDWIEAARAEFLAAEADPRTLMITPMVLEIVARRD